MYNFLLIMFGSLQEFMPEYFNIKNNQSFTNQPAISHSLRLPQESQSSRKNRLIWEQSTSKNIDVNVIRFANQPKKIDKRESPSQNQSNSKAKLRIQSTFSQPLSSEKPKSKVQFREYFPSDKSVLLQSYQRLKNGSQIQEREILQLKRMQSQMQNKTETSQKQPLFYHLKGKLKNNHHLLKSLVRVEQQQMVSQKTAFQISFGSISSKLREVKLQNKLRQMDDIVHDIKSMRFPLFLNKKQLEVKSYQSSLQRSKQRISSSQSKNPKLKLVEDNIKKWTKSRSKSQQAQHDKEGLYPGGKSLELRATQQNRKKMMGNISKLVNLPNNVSRTGNLSSSQRKYSYSLRKSSYVSTS